MNLNDNFGLFLFGLSAVICHVCSLTFIYTFGTVSPMIALLGVAFNVLQFSTAYIIKYKREAKSYVQRV